MTDGTQSSDKLINDAQNNDARRGVETADVPTAVVASRPVSLVTGAGRGIGRGIAVELAKLHHAVVINYAGNRDAAEECLQLVIDAGGVGLTVRADISSKEDRARLVQETLEAYGRIDLLVNNAGVAPDVRADLLEASEESFERLININLKGPYFLTQLVARQMIEQVQSGKHVASPAPRIVTISSVSADAASINRGDYCVSKAGLAMMTKLFAVRLAEFGIGVYEIRPGVIATEMTAGVKEKYDKLIEQGTWPIRRWGEPSDIGRAVAVIARGDLPYSTGEVLNVDGGFHLRTL
jgi:NAD(P)-dependent dehydrogenase (short-subunit alcohol dehydrogenase family)